MQFVFNPDITKMYQQILVDSKHSPFQRILFRNSDGNICDYELNTVTFGVNCAPFLALRVIQHVDDVLAGAYTKEQAIMAIQELRKALDSAGFPLRKLTSNKKGVLRQIPKDHLLRADFLKREEASVAKTLGIRWPANTDEFFFAPSEFPTTNH